MKCDQMEKVPISGTVLPIPPPWHLPFRHNPPSTLSGRHILLLEDGVQVTRITLEDGFIIIMNVHCARCCCGKKDKPKTEWYASASNLRWNVFSKACHKTNIHWAKMGYFLQIRVLSNLYRQTVIYDIIVLLSAAAFEKNLRKQISGESQLEISFH